jgi:glycosyltransferase involved in cell wall biosynthesis
MHSPLVLTIDDGSTDDTALIAQEHGSVVLRNATNQGLGASLRRGFSYLLARGYKDVVTLDGDGVHEPEFIPELISTHLAAGADLTIGSRFTDRSFARPIPSPKTAANRFATGLVNRGIGKSLTDVASGMRVVGERLLSADLKSTDFAIAYELVIIAAKLRLKIEECPISVFYHPDTLFCTKRVELLEFLRFILQWSDDRMTHRLMLQLTNQVEKFETIHLTLGGRYFVLHPIPDRDSFLFQDSHDMKLIGPSLSSDDLVVIP